MNEKTGMDAPERYEELLQAYLTICNQAMSKHGENFPYKEIWTAALADKNNDPMRLAVIDDRLKACVSVTAEDKVLSCETASGPGQDWIFSYSYLSQVVENAEDYVNDPARLDWAWLMMHIG